MTNITLSIPAELKHKMDKHKEIRWSNAIRSLIEQKLADFDEAQQLVKKSKLTMKDVELLSAQVDKAMGKHAEALLNEIRGRR